MFCWCMSVFLRICVFACRRVSFSFLVFLSCCSVPFVSCYILTTLCHNWLLLHNCLPHSFQLRTSMSYHFITLSFNPVRGFLRWILSLYWNGDVLTIKKKGVTPCLTCEMRHHRKRVRCHAMRDAQGVTLYHDQTCEVSHHWWITRCHTISDVRGVTPCMTCAVSHHGWITRCHTMRDLRGVTSCVTCAV